MSNQIELMQKKAKYFLDNKKAVHVSFTKGFFKNGDIKEISSDFFILDDFLEGEMPVFFLEVEDIEEYTMKYTTKAVGK